MTEQLIAAHGGIIINQLVSPDRRAEIETDANGWPSWELTHRQLCDLELVLSGAFSPLKGFLCRSDYESVCHDMRLTNGTVWPIPITLDVPHELAEALRSHSSLALKDTKGNILAALKVEDIWQPDLIEEAKLVYGTRNTEHPGVARLLADSHPCYVGGVVEGLELPRHSDFTQLRLTPGALRGRFAKMGWSRVVAFQTRNPMHRAHHAVALQASRELQANLLIHPVVGLTKPGDVDHNTRVRCYQTVLKHFPAGTAMLSLLPLAMRMAGPREAVLHAILRKNYGCSHFIVGRDHAGPGKDSKGIPFYGPYDAQHLVRELEQELQIAVAPFREMVYVVDLGKYLEVDKVPEGSETKSLSGSELRQRLSEGQSIPEWFSFPEVAAELKKTCSPRQQ